MSREKENNKSLLTIVLGFLAIIGVTLLFVGFTYIGTTNSFNQQEVKMEKLKNNIDIEKEEIFEIQEEMKRVIEEYTDYERESTELVVENLNPQFVLDMYPNLKSNSMYNKLNRQYLTSMRRIKDAKERYNVAVSDYNSSLVTITNKILHGDREQKDFLP